MPPAPALCRGCDGTPDLLQAAQPAMPKHRGNRPIFSVTTCGIMPGGGGRDRTDDPLLAKQVLSQLSYTPHAKPTKPPAARKPQPGGPGRTRTSDPTLIKRVL